MDRTILENRPTVIVRAFKDEPAKLIAVSHGRGLVEVANQDTGESICVQIGWVYQYRECEYIKLMTAFRIGDKTALAKLWDGVPHFSA